jgi:hypothetical protein
MIGIYRKGIAWSQARGDTAQSRRWLHHWEIFGVDGPGVSQVRQRLDRDEPIDLALPIGQSPRADSRRRSIDTPLILKGGLGDRLRRVAPGSTRHTVAEIVDDDAIYVGVPWRALDQDTIETDDLSSHLTSLLTRTPADHGYLVLAAPGSGKSILTLRLAQTLLNDGLTVVHIDLADYKHERGLPDFASASWCRERCGVDPESPNDASTIIVADSLDEILTGLTQPDINDLLLRALFVRANVLTCRLSYFERYLSASPFAERRPQRFELLGLSPAQQDLLASRYLTAAFPEQGPRLADLVIDWLDLDTTRRDICAFPLHLMLAVEAVSPSRNNLEAISDLVGLWQGHVEQVLHREAQRPAALLDAKQSAAILEAAAWHFYDEEGAGNASPPLFTRAELHDLLGSLPLAHHITAVADEIENRTLITGAVPPSVPEPDEMLRFTHRSLHVYLVARHLYHEMIAEHGTSADSFSKFLSGEVSRMLLEFIERLRRQPRLAARAVANLDAIVSFASNAGRDAITRARTRIARQQAAYYLGAIGGSAARRALSDAISEEPDLWVARGMAIGLSLSGDHDHLMTQIERRRTERSAGGSTPYCDVNLGYHLSFAGDQPLDVLAPDADQGESSCALTVATLVRQLELPGKRGSWRSTLFTFVDLAKHRPISRASFEDAVRRDRKRLEVVLTRLQVDPESQEWPEVDEATNILAELDDD